MCVRNSYYRSNGGDISNRRWSGAIRGMVRTPMGMPEMLMAAVKPMMLFAIPPISFSMGVVIGIGLPAQGVKG